MRSVKRCDIHWGFDKMHSVEDGVGGMHRDRAIEKWVALKDTTAEQKQFSLKVEHRVINCFNGQFQSRGKQWTKNRHCVEQKA